MAENKKNTNNENNNDLHEKDNKLVMNENEMNEDQRVKILSPGMLVMKRFMRNKLAIVGTTILIVMILFSFVGGAFVPYKENQSFMKTEERLKDYAAVSENTQPMFFFNDDFKAPDSMFELNLLAAFSEGKSEFKTDDTVYSLNNVSDGFTMISNNVKLGSASVGADFTLTNDTYESDATDEVKSLFAQAVKDQQSIFEHEDTLYYVSLDDTNTAELYRTNEIGVITTKVISTVEGLSETTQETDPLSSTAVFVINSEFVSAVEVALGTNETSFTVGENEFTLEEGDHFTTIFWDGAEFATISDYSMRSVEPDVVLSLDFRAQLSEAIAEEQKSFTFEDTTYEIERDNTNYTVRSDKTISVLDIYADPSSAHWLGTNKDGMDNLTRLMYGGRISLIIGIVVVILELLVGIILGGIAGYFGGWVDNLIMRMVDIVICIPAMPIYIILGSIMDTMQVDAQMRIYYLMLVLGILSWPSIARMVRAQILSLREQEFMIATEATGLSVKRRIFKHLIPNVIPQLIVIATMDLGNIILTEATLSFLGLGVKFPYASWGNIINAVNDSYVMTHYWFVWIPAGFLILATVLGFNFVGDGLRDAFDPKMKR